MKESESAAYGTIKSQLAHRKNQACVISAVSAVIIFCALIYLTIVAGPYVGLTTWKSWIMAVLVVLYLVFSFSAFSFLNGYIFRWSVDEFENIHYGDKDYIELTERIYKELKYKL